MSVSTKKKKAFKEIDGIRDEYDVDFISVSPQKGKGKTPKQNTKQKSKVTQRRSPKSNTKLVKEEEGMDESWEMAVEKARGKPDGGLSSGSSDEEPESDTASDDQEMDSDTENMQQNIQAPNRSKKTQPEKEKTKTLNVISKAAGKLKKMKGKQNEDSEKKTKKRKSDGEKATDDGKKAKLEEMTKKDRKKQRKMQHTNYVLSQDAKKLWEDLRRMDLPPAQRHKVSTDLYKIIQGKAKDLIFAHDTSRVIQCMMKYGAQEHKNALFDELKDEMVVMAKSKYAKFFVRKLLKYGTKDQRQCVFKSLYTHVRKLIKHKEAAEIIECAYNDYANAHERAALVEEFYGPSFALFKTQELRSLEQIMSSNPEKKESILSNMKESLAILVQKSVLQFSIVHRVFVDYFTYCSDKQRTEMIEIVREKVIHMLHTRDGARIAMIALWYGAAKDRKLIIKSMKTYVTKICKEEYGHMVLLAVFDVVDDTKIVQKIVLEEIIKNMHEIAQDQYGRKVLLYLLSPRDPKHFHPDIVKVLHQGDGNPHSKKDAPVRRSELLEAVSRPLVQYIVKHCEELVLNNAALILILSVITHVKSDPTDAMVAVSRIAAKPFTGSSNTDSQQHIIEHPAGHMTLKRLILNDADRIKHNQKVLFSSILLDVLPKGALKTWAACNRGCFLLLFLVEQEVEEIRHKVLKELSGIQDSLRRMEFKGAQILLKKLKEL